MALMLTPEALESEAARVCALVEESAADVIRTGDASLTVTSIRALYGADADYECPVVLLTPANPSAAELRVEVQGAGEWWCDAGGGPGHEFYDATLEERAALLRDLVAAVVAGRYEWGVETRSWRALLPPWRRKQARVRVARFFVEGREPVTVEHWPSRPPQPRSITRFAPYRVEE